MNGPNFSSSRFDDLNPKQQPQKPLDAADAGLPQAAHGADAGDYEDGEAGFDFELHHERAAPQDPEREPRSDRSWRDDAADLDFREQRDELEQRPTFGRVSDRHSLDNGGTFAQRPVLPLIPVAMPSVLSPAAPTPVKARKAGASSGKATKRRPSKKSSARKTTAARAGHKPAARARRATRTRSKARSRRGVASVLAMMFLVLFGSLCAAMAVVAQSNLRTADSGLKLNRAMSAAETGMVFAARRLQEQASRFVVEKGVIDAGFAEDIWVGTVDQGADGAVVIEPLAYETTTPDGVLDALLNAHLHDEDEPNDHCIEPEAGDGNLPIIDEEYGRLRCKPIALSSDPDSP